MSMDLIKCSCLPHSSVNSWCGSDGGILHLIVLFMNACLCLDEGISLFLE